MVEKLAAGESPAEATCPAAADLNMDGRIDAANLPAMRRMMSKGRIVIPALHYQFRLPCRFKRLLVAARPEADLDGSNPIYLLDPRFTSENSKVEVVRGSATVRPMPDHRGFIVKIAGSSPRSGHILLRITLGPDGSGGRFYYTYRSGRADNAL